MHLLQGFGVYELDVVASDRLVPVGWLKVRNRVLSS